MSTGWIDQSQIAKLIEKIAGVLDIIKIYGLTLQLLFHPHPHHPFPQNQWSPHRLLFLQPERFSNHPIIYLAFFVNTMQLTSLSTTLMKS